ncbi:MAG: MBL fold metallo-hydrolase [Rhodospirillaceae bacterium]|nr:MBL fold metallo-hydrolase [Rhodospirillaceae bacterium]MYB13723.1 MBL fold metallo-hydrolase [Rhodospirillaceae bacterium]MYI47789.1 MBL fold metallo-hydrolase [Rhodospirillaceae bacterium]
MSARPAVETFFHEPTFTATHVAWCPDTGKAAIIDSVRDFCHRSGRLSSVAAEEVAAFVRGRGLTVERILETHAHADHLSAAPWLKRALGGRIGIGVGIVDVQRAFADVFNSGPDFSADGSQFDDLFGDGAQFALGNLTVEVLHTPGHTPACVSYLAGDAAFVGDTIFMPDYGSARCDFPGGDARTLYRSVQRLFALPDDTRVFLCHDYKAPGRDTFAWQTTIGEQRRRNIHIHEGIGEDGFVEMRTSRDGTLEMPLLIIPSIQVNVRAGRMPPAEDDGAVYLKVPLNRL